MFYVSVAGRLQLPRLSAYYWQYMDKLVYWAGSASEGIIIPPPAGSIDATHQSGVKVLGQVFFPPYEYGGNQAWVRQMLTKENGVYIYAK